MKLSKGIKNGLAGLALLAATALPNSTKASESELYAMFPQGKSVAISGANRDCNSLADYLVKKTGKTRDEVETLMRNDRKYGYSDCFSTSTQQADWVSPAWRSAVVPGLGQWYNEDKTKALVLGGLTWGLLAGTAVTFYDADAKGKKYQSLGSNLSQDKYDGAFDDWKGAVNTNHILNYLFYAAYAWNVIDAITSAKVPTNRVQLTNDGVKVSLLETKF